MWPHPRKPSDSSHILRLQPEELTTVGGSAPRPTNRDKRPAAAVQSRRMWPPSPQTLRHQSHPPVATGGTRRSRRMCPAAREPEPAGQNWRNWPRLANPPTPATPSGCNRSNSPQPEDLSRAQPTAANELAAASQNRRMRPPPRKPSDSSHTLRLQPEELTATGGCAPLNQGSRHRESGRTAIWRVDEQD
jgi:hypothetical protein